MNVKVTPEIEKLLIEKYLSGLTLIQTGKIFNISTYTVHKYLIKNNIKIRNLSESHKGKYSEKFSTLWKGGKPKCLVCKKQLSTYKNKYCREHFRTAKWKKNIGKSHIGLHPKSEFVSGHIPKNKGKFGKNSPVWTGGRRIVSAKYKAKRNRELNFIFLNKNFENSEGHHINDTYVIFIPKILHKQYLGHAIKRPKSMIQINIEAFKFMNPDVYTHLIEDYTTKF